MTDRPPLYAPPDYLDRPDFCGDHTAILNLRQERVTQLDSDRLKPYREALGSLEDLPQVSVDGTGAVVKIGPADTLSPEQYQRLYQALRAFCPWKKGPFNFFGIEIDAEWRSDWKWQRILPHIQSLQGRKIADIGCHNGYFMLRMVPQQPELVIGFEPYGKLWWNFQLIQNLIHCDRLYFELLGVEHIHFYPHWFDTIFCLGILYHHPDPIGLLNKLRLALASKGEIVIDCQGIPGSDPVAFTPRQRYANARGIWFLPTQSCLENWLYRAGFIDIHCFFAEPLTIAEQRRTEWADIDSLKEFLDPHRPSRTIEGYPAPWRYYFIARKA
ncbi:tRNA 5-methoxyuridine(34)/uridine 5-oxyacetic acid(34) synthase CmoB [Trichothermofontia sp.]